jgi:Tfp pilus assembly protein PilV
MTTAKHRVRSRERGFTLVEVMVALLLTVVAVIGIVALYMVETRASGFSRHEGEASVLAEDKMEVLRTVTPPASGSDATPVDPEGGTGGIYTRVWSITAGSAAGYSDYTVQVKWTEDGVPRSLTEYSHL